MKSFVSATTWRDLTDGHLYHEGEPFPFDGREVDPGRIGELESGRNRAGMRLIRAVAAEKDKTDEPKAEAPKTASRGRKTAKAKRTD